MFTTLHHDFAEALFDPGHKVPDDIGLCHADGATRRFNIYRNNVAVSLIDALAARFPVTREIVGEAFFTSMARVFIGAHPPTSPLMMFYGDYLPAFIASFEPAASLPYLADLARLEAARTRAYHAEDQQPLDPSALQSLSAEDLENLHFLLHPSLEIIASPHPIVTIWAMHEGLIPLGEISDWHGETAVVVRPQFDVEVRCLPPGGVVFLHGLLGGKSLAEAAENAAADDFNFDLAINLAALFSAGLAIALSIPS